MEPTKAELEMQARIETLEKEKKNLESDLRLYKDWYYKEKNKATALRAAVRSLAAIEE